MRWHTVNMLKRLLMLAAPLAPILALSALMGTVGALFAVFLNVSGVLAVYRAATGMEMKHILILALLFAAGRGIFRYIEQLSGHYIAFKILAVLRDKVFRALRRTAPAKLEEKNKGELITVITSDVELLEVFYAHTIVPVVTAAATSVCMTVFLWQYHPLIGIIALAAYLLTGAALPVVNTRTGGSEGDTLRRRLGKLSALFLENLKGIHEIIRYSCGRQRLDHINHISGEISGVSAKLKKREGVTGAVTDAVITVFTVLTLTAGLRLMAGGAMDLEGVLVTTTAILSSFGTTAALGSLSNNLVNTLASGRRVLDILDEASVTPDILHGKNPSFTGAGLQKVAFGYENAPVLRECSARFDQNCIIGITGKSGSGKSTVLKLLMRFWEADSGRVLISDEDIRRVNTAHLRKLEGYMTQETFLFHDTILANIRIASLDAGEDEVIGAAKKASIHDFIMTLPEGYKTNAGELGSRFSGGERQRIGLARIFLCGAPFMLLDEPTSNLDALNEAVILKSVKEHSRDKTVVLVSHREGALRIADTLYYVEDGKAAENCPEAV